MANLIRPLGYTGSLQRMIWTQGDGVPVTAYLWGGGGGGGGSDYAANGGNGTGGGYSQVTFNVYEGDVIEVAVGGGGLAGANFNSGVAGGQAGFSLTESEIFNLRTFPISFPNWITGVTAYPFSSDFGTYLNNNGTWDWPYTLGTYSKSYTVTFPEDGNYQFTGAASYNATFYLDGVKLFTANDRSLPFTVGYPVQAGTRTLTIQGENRWYRFNNTGSLALTIGRGNSFGGGRGGNSESEASFRRSGGGGGGGGATVILVNGQVVGVAAGGGGGGGSSFYVFGENAPGTRGIQPAGQNSGQNGTSSNVQGFFYWKSGGGGGGGGGGYGGGNGGYVDYYGGLIGSWSKGYAGTYGGNLGISENPSGVTPGGASSPYYVPGTATGGSGNPALNGNGSGGYAALFFDVNGIFVNNGSGYQGANKVWIKNQDVWNQVEAAYVKTNGIWEPVLGSASPVFEPVVGRFGINPRGSNPLIFPEPAPPTVDAGGYDGGGGGGAGAKIICTKLYKLGLMNEDIYQADQAFGAELIKTRPDIYNGYRAWADIVVDWINGAGPNMMPWMDNSQQIEIIKQWSTSWAQDIATPWAEEMAYKMGVKKQGSIAGKLITAAGMPICKAVGMWQRLIGPSKTSAGFGTGATLIAMFVLFKGVAEFGRLLDKLTGNK